MTSNFPRWAGDSTTPFVLRLCQDLTQSGWDVDVVAPHFSGAATSEVLGGVRVDRFRYAVPDAAQTVCYQGGAMVNLRQRPWEKLKLPLFVAAEWAAVQERLQGGEYDVLHSHWVLPQGFVGALASLATGVPHVITLHGGDVFSLTGKVMTSLKGLALRRASGVTVNSSFTERAVREIAPGLDAIERIPMGVNVAEPTSEECALSEQVRRERREDGGPLVVFVGRLVEEKGADDAITAMSKLRELPAARLLVIGEGPERQALEDLSASLGLQECVKFLGWVQPGDVRAYMTAADIFVGPSRRAPDGWVEAQGLTFVEAMAAGTVVVATRSGGIVDAVEDGTTGILVDERAPEQIARAIERLWADDDKRQLLAEAGRARARDRFSRSYSAARFAQLFRVLTER